MSSFGLDVQKFADKSMRRFRELRANCYVQVAGGIVDDTPVKTGYTAGNWLASSGSPRSGRVRLRGREAVHAEIARVANAAKADEPLYLRNNLPWIWNLENGSSKQAPQGMLRKNLTKFRRVLKSALGKARG